MKPAETPFQNDSEPISTMERRGFLKTLGAAAGLATVIGPDALHGIEAAVRNTAGLTPHEAARLQTFPDWFDFGGASRSMMARAIGNAVPPLLLVVLGQRLLPQLPAVGHR